MAQIPTNVDIFGCLSFLKEIYIFFEEPIGFSTCPKKSEKNLEREMEDLKRIRDVVTTIFQEQERMRPGTECEVEVKGWLDKVNGIDTEVNTHLDKLAESRNCTCCCFPCHNYFLGKEVVDLIEQVRKLVEERESFDDDNLVRSIPPDPIDNVPDLPTTMVGRDGKSSEIHGYLRDSEVTTIGIWGRGGIGKTTMLKSIKQWLSGNDHDFQYIIWIEMSQNDDDVLKIQKQIAKCIFLSLPSEHEEKENKEKLANSLRRRKSLVLIDNVWKKLNFERIGIPFAVGTNFVKILFTTRSQKVCTDMRAQKIVRFDSLDYEKSLQLFQGNISPDVDLTEKIVRQRVDEILKICDGLPLVIVTVARTVANYTLVEEWDDAVECLRSSREEIEGMDDVMKHLKFSYDKLEDDKIKSCLLYLSLYDEGYQVRTDLLIIEWLAEGFLDTPNDNSFARSYRRGVVNINKLKSICLLENTVYSDDEVKLHDEIRHMLCWIREHENKEVCIVYDDQISDCNYDRWDLAKRIYLHEGQLKGLPETGIPLCRNLTSLLVEAEDYAGNRIDKLPTEEFFHFTPSLRVLDLSFTGLVEIPKSIGELVELRYLNLYRTLVHTVPMELGNLKKLKCLDLGDTWELITIVGSAIFQLSALQSLNFFNTSYQWKSDDVNMTTQPPLLKLEDLRELKNLEDLGVDVRSNSHLDTILCDEKFLKSITRISFVRINFTTIDLGGLQLIEWISQRLPELKNLIVDGCALATDILEIKDDQLPRVTELSLRRLEMLSVTLNDASRPFSRLKNLHIFGCQRLKGLSWTARIPSLVELQVEDCNSVKELIVEEEEEEEELPQIKELVVEVEEEEEEEEELPQINELVEEEEEEIELPQIKELVVVVEEEEEEEEEGEELPQIKELVVVVEQEEEEEELPKIKELVVEVEEEEEKEEEELPQIKELVVVVEEEEEEEEEEEIKDYFPNLVTLHIKDLKNLQRIHRRSPLLFPALRHLIIENCPKLKQLSFGDDTAKNMEFILCEETQWDSLEWENDQVQAKFSPYLHPF